MVFPPLTTVSTEDLARTPSMMIDSMPLLKQGDCLPINRIFFMVAAAVTMGGSLAIQEESFSREPSRNRWFGEWKNS
jgi:hypothetical protein